MFSSVTSWLGVGERPDKNSDENKENVDDKKSDNDTKTNDSQQEQQQTTKGNNDNTRPTKTEGDIKEKDPTEVSKDANEENVQEPSNQQILEDVSAKALNTAKEWGSYLYSFGKIAGQTVADTAKQIKSTVEEKTILGDFGKEQEKFVAGKKEEKRHQEAAVAPWVGYNEEEAMRKQIVALSQDKRNFLRSPPSGVQFQFDFEAMYPIAMATLQEDLNLKEKRFDLVPKRVTEEIFWRNYFYRVSLIKQSTQLTSIAQQSGESRSSNSSRRSSLDSKGSSEHKGEVNQDITRPKDISKDEDTPQAESPNENEFVSDAFSGNPMDDEALKKEMELLGVKEDEEWEKELQQELQDYEMVEEGEGQDSEDDLEQEILKQIEQEAKLIS